MSIRWLFLFFLLTRQAWAQDDLMNLLNKETPPAGPDYTIGTFKSTRLINGHSVETRAKNVLEFVISHRFGTLNSTAYQFFGLDDAEIRLGLDYGVTDRLNIGFGRNSFQKTFDGFVKYKILRQASGTRNTPISVVLFASVAATSLRSPDFPENAVFSDRLAFVYQGLIARKLSQRVSLQLSPTWVHRNLVLNPAERNDIFALGIGGRYKLTKRVALNVEYYYHVSESSSLYYNSLALGFDIETGGHVFQLHFTNSRGMIEKAFITETTGDFFNGNIHLGFNISRSFNLGKKQERPAGYGVPH